MTLTAAVAVLAAYVTDAGVWVISLLVICLMVLGFRAYRSSQTRRVVAVLWDLGTFWPRTVHPFAPPCYAARAVPELAKRVTGLTAWGPVVLSGHSHGSVLAAATILQLPPPVLARVSLLTYGSPLHRTYAPAVSGVPGAGDALRPGWADRVAVAQPVAGDRPDRRADLPHHPGRAGPLRRPGGRDRRHPAARSPQPDHRPGGHRPASDRTALAVSHPGRVPGGGA
ncbi:hypothetical protein HNR22_001048 [Micromonospora jinlongensis]|uniref:Alpha/beta hydrolase family protein n=1 Tax=Micromonospora jinlongensis TaxID=1287877 RepID=A0A7Z0BBZ6_9ACTN|nr:hypothetical protein [Micromonospora jinlongensis]NYH41321.1 hypothetical protein [Micromonospora jinlongensis]